MNVDVNENGFKTNIGGFGAEVIDVNQNPSEAIKKSKGKLSIDEVLCSRFQINLL